MIFLILSLTLEEFINQIKKHYQLSFYNKQINALNISKWNLITNSNLMFEYNSMFENGYISIGYEISPSILFEDRGYRNEINSKIYNFVKEKNEFIFNAIEDYLEALEIKSEIEIQKRILENYLKIQNLLEAEHKYSKIHTISKLILNQSKIINLKTRLKSLEIDYERYINKLNFYTKIDSIEDVLEIPKLNSYSIEQAIDYKAMEYELNSNKNYLKASYLKFLPSIKPSILRRTDNTYGFMLSFSIPIYPLNEIRKNKEESESKENYLNSLKDFLETKFYEIEKDYERYVLEYENYKKQKEELEKTLNSILSDYKFSNEMSLVEYYELLNEILSLELEIRKAKYRATLKVFELNSYFEKL